MKLRIHDEADEELEAAFDYYEHQQRGLGQQFLDEYVKAIHTVAEHPERWPLEVSVPREANVHRYRLNRFPYAIVYQIRGGDALVVSVMHLRRKPGYWRDRTS